MKTFYAILIGVCVFLIGVFAGAAKPTVILKRLRQPPKDEYTNEIVDRVTDEGEPSLLVGYGFVYVPIPITVDDQTVGLPQQQADLDAILSDAEGKKRPYQYDIYAKGKKIGDTRGNKTCLTSVEIARMEEVAKTQLYSNYVGVWGGDTCFNSHSPAAHQYSQAVAQFLITNRK